MDFSKDNDGTKFFFNDDHPEMGSVTVRIPPKKELDRITELTVTEKKKFRRNVQVIDIKTNQKMMNTLMWDYQIVAWENVSLAGKKLECNSDNKFLMMNEVPSFTLFIVNCVETLEQLAEKMNPTDGDKQRKNSDKP